MQFIWTRLSGSDRIVHNRLLFGEGLPTPPKGPTEGLQDGGLVHGPAKNGTGTRGVPASQSRFRFGPSDAWSISCGGEIHSTR